MAMATGSATRIYHGTLVASTVDTVTLAVFSRTLTVINRGSGDIFVTVGATSASTPTPTVGGAEEFVIPANTSGTVWNQAQVPSADQAPLTQTVVKLISSGTPAYTVQSV